MKFLVTGANGFIGSYVVRELTERGDEVIAFDLRPPSSDPKVLGERLTWVQSDVRQLQNVENVVIAHRPEVIIHMAGLLQFGCMENPRLAVELNVLGLSNVLEAARKHGVRRVVTASSSAVYGPLKTDVRESASIPPNVSLYGATKFFGEILCRQYIQNYQLEAVNLRYYGVYGPGEVRSPGMAQLLMEIQRIVSGKDVRIPKIKGSDHTHLVFVTDAAHATVLAATVPGPLRLTYNIAGGPQDFVSFEKMVEMIRKIEPRSGRVIFEGQGEAIGLNPFDISLARKELGFEPRVTLAEGLRESIAYLKRTQRG
jgi:UDP-glucose 4-epimerase